LPSLTLGLRPSSPPGENEGKWPKLGKPGKEARREEGSPGARRREKPKWFAKLGWWKDARPCLRRESPILRSPIRAGSGGARTGVDDVEEEDEEEGEEVSSNTGITLSTSFLSSAGGGGGGETGLAG
jgi:hypothetical protein